MGTWGQTLVAIECGRLIHIANRPVDELCALPKVEWGWYLDLAWKYPRSSSCRQLCHRMDQKNLQKDELMQCGRGGMGIHTIGLRTR